MNENRITDRRKVSQEGRDRYEEFSRERADVERRLELVAIQARVIAHVTANGAPAPTSTAPNGTGHS